MLGNTDLLCLFYAYHVISDDSCLGNLELYTVVSMVTFLSATAALKHSKEWAEAWIARPGWPLSRTQTPLYQYERMVHVLGKVG